MHNCLCNSRRAGRLNVGDVLHGFAQGAFGRDDYDCKIVELVSPEGVRNAWIMLRYLENGERTNHVTLIQADTHEAIYKKYSHALEKDDHCLCDGELY